MARKPIKDLLKENKVTVVSHAQCIQASPNLSIGQTIELMRNNKSGYVLLVDGGQVTGIFTEVDVVRKILCSTVDWSKPVRTVMTQNPSVLTQADSVGTAIDLMGKERFYHIPLVDEKKNLAGIISVRSVIKFLAEFYPTEVYNLPPDPHQVMNTQEGG